MSTDQSRWRVRRFDEAHFEHPTSEPELVALILRARTEHAQLRVRGSAHSVAAAVYTDAFDPESGPVQPGAPVINVMLDRYRGLHFHQSGGVDFVTVEAGRNLGSDPYGPGTTPGDDEGLVHALAARGFALPVLGGISHQTLSGFLGTGSAGASVQHGFHQAIASIRVLDGLGNARDLTPSDPDFAHVGVSMGLMGIVSSVTLRLEPEYVIRGWTSVQRVADCDIDLFGDGDATRPSLKTFFETTPYARLLYWPQKGVERVEIWTAERAAKTPGWKPKPYKQFNTAPFLMQWLVRFLYTRVLPRIDLVPGDADAAMAEAWLRDAITEGFADAGLGAPTLSGPLVDPMIDALAETLADVDDGVDSVKEVLVREMIRLIIALSPRAGGKYERKAFTDTWYDGLPHDNQMDDQLMPVLFTELWAPLDKTPVVMRALRDFWSAGGLEATGTFATEIYAAPPSPFTLSAAHGTPVLRIDPFVFWREDAKPEQDFFPGYWELLRAFDVRFHWGKTLSAPGSTTGVSYRRDMCGAAAWDAWKARRAAWDPDGLFVNAYWRAHLGL
ncbi:MAG: D-arabinono-1,4-lactone oxidase [Polyangiales bacterium]